MLFGDIKLVTRNKCLHELEYDTLKVTRYTATGYERLHSFILPMSTCSRALHKLFIEKKTCLCSFRYLTNGLANKAHESKIAPTNEFIPARII